MRTDKRSQNMTLTTCSWQAIFVDIFIKLKITSPQTFADPTPGYQQALSHPELDSVPLDSEERGAAEMTCSNPGLFI